MVLGATNRLSTINIYTYDGEVGSLYGGSNEEGIVYGLLIWIF